MPSRLNQAVLQAATVAYRQLGAVAPSRENYLLHRLTVISTTQLAPRVWRVKLGADSLREFQPMGPDEYFAAVLPRPGVPLQLPDPEVLQVARAVARMPEAQRPDVRYYTVRHHRPEAGEIDVDVVTHDVGPGSRWVSTAQPGDEIGFKEGSAGYRAPEGNGLQLVAADETSLPALMAIADQVRGTPAAGWIKAFIEVEDDEVVGERPEGINLTWVKRTERPGDALAEAIWADPERGYTTAWLCAAGGAVARLRKQLKAETRIDRRQVFSKGYWQQGRETQH